METELLKSRYPGIRAFEKSEQKVFFGRDVETKKLFSLIKAKSLVVLFSKSGLGKSSLINAGVEPLLEKDDYQTVKIRLQDTSQNPIEAVKQALQPFLNEKKLKVHTDGAHGLWEYLRACEFSKNGNPVVPLLIFDQFEEYFEHSKQNQDKLNLELADLISERLPERIQEHLRSIPFRDRTVEELEWHSPMPVKFLMAIRSDRISLLDEMSVQIPSILHSRFHLKPLNLENARAAIEQPAKYDEEKFDTLPFSYDEKAMQTILNYLKNKNDEIESFQLQLLCHYIEKRVLRKQEKNIIVYESDFGGAKGIKSILNNYYEAEIEELETDERPFARKFIEEGLIVGGRRVGVSEGVEAQNFGITPVLLSKLLKSRLIRAENTHLGRSYELSHDTLVAPILESYEIRRQEEERIENEKRRQEQEKLLEIEKKKRRKALLLAAAGFILFFFALVFGLYAGIQTRKAKEAESEAKKAYARVDSTLVILKKTQEEKTDASFREYLQKGKSNVEIGRYEQAASDFEFALRFKPDNTEADSLKQVSIKKGGVKVDYDKLMERGETALRSKDYITALKNFRTANNLNINQTASREAKLKADEARVQLLPQFKSLVSDAQTFLNAESCDYAKQSIRKAENIAQYLNQNSIQAELNQIKRIKQKCR